MEPLSTMLGRNVGNYLISVTCNRSFSNFSAVIHTVIVFVCGRCSTFLQKDILLQHCKMFITLLLHFTSCIILNLKPKIAF